MPSRHGRLSIFGKQHDSQGKAAFRGVLAKILDSFLLLGEEGYLPECHQDSDAKAGCQNMDVDFGGRIVRG